MLQYKQDFDTYMGVKSSPNEHEKYLLERAQKYIQRLTWIPGIEMIAVVNSLSMYATHEDSDIDLFIVTDTRSLWFVRTMTTLVLWTSGVWRHGEDIAGNFCLSFFVTTGALDMEKIAIENDIYLYYWIYYMKPIVARGDIYEQFLRENKWVRINEAVRQENLNHRMSPSRIVNRIYVILSPFVTVLNSIFRSFGEGKTLRNYERLGRPGGVIISDNMLKFHDQDRRVEIRDNIFQKNFDK